jgi:hypothetical protein
MTSTTTCTSTVNRPTERNTMILSRSLAVAVAIGVLTLTGCGSDDGEAADDVDSAQTDRPSGVPSGAPSGGPGMGDVDFEAIQACLTAAGLDDVMPTDVPTDMPTDMPTDFPTDGTPPEGMPSGGPGGGMGALQDPEVQAALEACGIDLPQAPGAGQS